MKKLIMILLIILVSITLSSCATGNERTYVQDFCNIDYSDRTLVIDGVYDPFIKDLDPEKSSDSRIGYEWWFVFFQFEDLYPLLRDDELFHFNIDVGYEELQADIKSAEEAGERIDFNSTLTLSYKKGLDGCSKEINVHYYDLPQSYDNQYGSLSSRSLGYNIEVSPSEYYSIRYEKNDKWYVYIAHIDDVVFFEHDNIKIDFERVYNGFDIIFYDREDNVLFKEYRYDYSNYQYFHSELGMLHGDREGWWYHDDMINDLSVTTTVSAFDPNPVEFAIRNKETNTRTYIKHDLEIGVEYTITEMEGTIVTYSKIDENYIEFVYDNYVYERTYRVKLK